MTTPTLDQKARALKNRFFKPGVFPIKAKGPITAVDWDGRRLRVAQSVRRGGKGEVEYLVAESVEHGFDAAKSDPAVAGACLAEELRRRKLKPGAVVMGIPRSLVFLRSLTLPPADSPEALVAMVYFQISRDLPFRPEDAVIDFQVNTPVPPPPPPTPAGAEPDAAPRPANAAKVDVLVAVVKRDVVQFYERVAAAAGLKLAALGFQSYANARALRAGWPVESRGTVALVSLRQHEVIIDVIADGLLLFSRTAALAPALGLEDPAATLGERAAAGDVAGTGEGAGSAAGSTAGEATALIDLVRIEVVRSLHNFTGSESRQPVERILVAGEAEQVEPLAGALAAALNLPCRPLAAVPIGAPRVAPDGGGGGRGLGRGRPGGERPGRSRLAV